MNQIWLPLSLIFISHASISQTWVLQNSITIEAPTNISTDSNGNIYLATFDGDIVRYDRKLVTKELFSPPNPARVDQLEAWQGLRIFTFHRELQQYRLINRNLSLHEDYGFPQEKVGFVHLATPTFDNNIWLIDQQDFSLKRYQIHSNTIPVLSPLNQVLDPIRYEISWMREFQNRLFIGVKDLGILLFDNMGNYLKTYAETGIDNAGFYGDQIYFIQDNQLVLVNIYNDERKLLTLPAGASWKFIIYSPNDMYLFSNERLSHYRIVEN